VITPNPAFERLFASRSCPARKLRVVVNSPDESIFSYRHLDGEVIAGPDQLRPFVIMYHGALVERHGLDLAVLALETVKCVIPDAELRIYGFPTPYLDRVLQLARERGLEESVRYLGVKSLEEIVRAIDECHVGIIPNRRSVFTEINFPTRIFEYLARAKPVVAPRSTGIQDYFQEDELIYFEMESPNDLALKIEYPFVHPRTVNEIVKRGQTVYRAHAWSRERMHFQELTGALVCASREAHGKE